MKEIPKIIHYCWFGHGAKPAIFDLCKESWAIYAPDFTVMEWNESNFDLSVNAFVRSSYDKKAWAFVSDFARAWALYNFGGIYLDTDCELRRPLNSFLSHSAFSGFQEKGFPFTALWGAQRGHKWPGLVLDYYASRDFSHGERPNTEFVSTILVDHFGIDPNKDRLQHGRDGVTIYPSSHFCVDLPQNFAVHHFDGSWVEHPANKMSFKKKVQRDFYLEQLSRGEEANELSTLIGEIMKKFGLMKIISSIFSVWASKLTRERDRFARKVFSTIGRPDR